MLQRFFTRIKSSPGREYEQAFLRLIIGLCVFIYVAVSHLDDPNVLIRIGVLGGLLFFATAAANATVQ